MFGKVRIIGHLSKRQIGTQTMKHQPVVNVIGIETGTYSYATSMSSTQ